MKTIFIKILRWILRVLSGIIILFLLFMFIGENFGSESGDPLTTNAIIQLSVTAIGLIGLGLAWKWELPGGIIALVAFIVLAIINPVILKAPLMYIWPIIAILFIVLWAISKNARVKSG